MHVVHNVSKCLTTHLLDKHLSVVMLQTLMSLWNVVLVRLAMFEHLPEFTRMLLKGYLVLQQY